MHTDSQQSTSGQGDFAGRAESAAQNRRTMSESANGVAKLIYRVAARDRAAFTQLYRATAPKLLGIVLRMLRDRSWADDVIQEAYVKIWQKADLFDADKSSPMTWLASVARHLAIDELRRNPVGRTSTGEDLEQVASRQVAVQEQLEREEDAGRLNHCIDELEKDRQDMVRLAYLYGWSRDELASQFEQPVNTVKTWLHRALKQIRRCLEL